MKALLSLGGLTALVVPIGAVVACGSSDEETPKDDDRARKTRIVKEILPSFYLEYPDGNTQSSHRNYEELAKFLEQNKGNKVEVEIRFMGSFKAVIPNNFDASKDKWYNEWIWKIFIGREFKFN